MWQLIKYGILLQNTKKEEKGRGVGGWEGDLPSARTECPCEAGAVIMGLPHCCALTGKGELYRAHLQVS